ncbi:hypothetical protein [Desulfatiglans anilini]|uniref:hypothetical protein n=1 Tax=Desulfatiglans anilini TaxID=90728 RepID=UPI00129465DE|nr:hypothetical protein [Desulfatiglans anilini]
MNDSFKYDIDNQQAEPAAPERRQDAPTALDKAFPSLWFMGMVIFVVILAILAMGWKISGLEDERVSLKLSRQELEHQRETLEKEKALYQKINEELPVLIQQRETLGAEIATLEGELKVQQINFETITRDLTRAQEALDDTQRKTTKAAKDREQALAEFQNLNSKAHESQSLVEQLTKEAVALRGSVEGLTKDRETLENAVAQLRKSKGELEAEVASLESRVKQKMADLERYAEDEKAFARLSDGFQIVLKKMQDSSIQADRSVSALDQEAEGLKTAAGTIKETSLSLKDVTTFLETQNSALNESVKDITAAVQKAEEGVSEMQTAGKGFTEANERMGGMAKEAETTLKELGSVQRHLLSVAHKLETAVGELDRGVKAAESQVASLEKSARNTDPAVESLQQTSQGIKEEYNGIKQSRQAFAALVTGQQEAAGQLLEATKSLQAQVSALVTAEGGIDQIEESLVGQSRKLETMLQGLSALKSRLEVLIASLERAPAVPQPSNDQQTGTEQNGSQLSPNAGQLQ